MFLSGRQISFSYSPQKPVLRNVSLNLEKGGTVSVVGPSGCGKSTLLRIISGILPGPNFEPIVGELTIDGKAPDEFRKSGELAFMFQQSTLLPNLTVFENIALPLKIHNTDADDRLSELLTMVGLTEYSDYLPFQLSGGMKTRVALARSFATQPKLLLLDEPFSSLDIAWKSKLYRELERLREAFGTTTVVVTHDVQEALLLSDQVVVMDSSGRVIQELPIDTARSLTERTENISEFMAEVYADYFIPIQEAIIATGRTRNGNPDGKEGS